MEEAKLNSGQLDEIKIVSKISRIKSAPDSERALGREESVLRKKIHKLEEDIALWRNNLSFFAASKTADKLKAEFEEKIKEAEDEIKAMKKDLRTLRQAVDE
ncbi:MAG: hypothetical protein HC842_08260 [Cytophagales bacterium]|nr:hypothetical protein [Cytophagales bacterium]